MTVESSEDQGTLRAVLRIERPERYRLTLSDRLGRTLFTLDAGPRAGWLLDHRERRACPFGQGATLRGVPLEPLPPEALVAVLLGRAPAAPAGPVEAGARTLSYQDASGRRWDVRLEATGEGGRRVASWTLHRDGEPALWWRRAGDELLLSDRERAVQIRWREVTRERLDGALPEPAVPPGFEVGDCSGTGEAGRELEFDSTVPDL
jgi:hypothetical protein